MANPYVPVPNVVDVQVRFTIFGSPCEFHWSFQYPTALTVTLMQQLGKIVVDWIINSVAPSMSGLITFTEVFLTDLTSQTAPSFAWTAGTSSNLPITGAGTNPPLSAQAALVISERTGNRGRSFRGRKYLPVIEQAALSEPLAYQASTAAFWLSAALTLVATAIGAGWSSVVVSKVSNKVPRTIGVATPVIQYLADVPVKTQRRRLL